MYVVVHANVRARFQGGFDSVFIHQVCYNRLAMMSNWTQASLIVQ